MNRLPRPAWAWRLRHRAGGGRRPGPTRVPPRPHRHSLAFGLAGGILFQALATKAEWGAVGAIPYRAHLRTDMAVGAAVAAAPWLFAFSRDAAARNTFLALGAGLFAAGLLSDPTEEGADFGE